MAFLFCYFCVIYFRVLIQGLNMTLEEAKNKFTDLLKSKMESVEIAGTSGGIPGYTTLLDKSELLPVESVITDSWSHQLFDGNFFRSKPKDDGLPQLSTVFVQDKNGNTDTASGNPGDLGGGETDYHLIYEGLSRLDADGVMAGANTIRGMGKIFSVWHHNFFKIRKKFASSLFPAQIIVTASGNIDIENELMFNLPDIRVFVITTENGANQLGKKIGDRSQVSIISTGEKIKYHDALQMLKSFGINKISVVGGRTTVSELFDQGFISDLYLTKTPLETGLENTPFYVGKKGLQPMKLVLQKEGKGSERGVMFEHYIVP
jgi:riboflavin biosynthesis pyrimidine reductase